jgi:AraC-like DNA-binding protein
LQWIVYSILTYPLIRTCIAFQKEENSQLNIKRVIWLKGIVALFILMGLSEGLAIFGIYKIPFFFIFTLLLLIFYAFYFFFFVLLFSEENNLLIQSTSIDSDLLEFHPELEDFDIHLWLQKFLELDLYLDPNITLQKVSDELKIPKYKLTQIIRNDGYTSFYSFINYFRVEKSKVLLKQMPDSFVVESVYHDSGFKSRSTYFRVFKEYTGQSPAEYKLNCKKEASI